LILNMGTSFDAPCIFDNDSLLWIWFPYMEVDQGVLFISSLKSEGATSWLWSDPGPATPGFVINTVKPDNSGEPNGPGVFTTYRDGSGTIYTLGISGGNLVADQQAFDPARNLPDTSSIPITVYVYHDNDLNGCPPGGTVPGGGGGTVGLLSSRINPLTHKRLR
jgi:hypothetical protein